MPSTGCTKGWYCRMQSIPTLVIIYCFLKNIWNSLNLTSPLWKRDYDTFWGRFDFKLWHLFPFETVRFIAAVYRRQIRVLPRIRWSTVIPCKSCGTRGIQKHQYQIKMLVSDDMFNICISHICKRSGWNCLCRDHIITSYWVNVVHSYSTWVHG